MVARLAQAIGSLGIATRTKGALMQPLYSERIVGDFRPDGEGKIGHRFMFSRTGPRRAHSGLCASRDMRLAFGEAQVYCGLSTGLAPGPRGKRPSCQPGRAVCRSASTISAANRR